MLFEQMGVLVGGATLEAVEAICGEPDDLKTFDRLTALIDQNLLWRDDRPPLQPRFHMLATLREYALEHLTARGEADTYCSRHAAYFAEWVGKAVLRLRTGNQVNALKELIAEHDNLRAALAWVCLTPGEVQTGLKMTARLWEFWVMHGDYEEGQTWIRRLLELPGAQQPTIWLAHSLNGLGLISESCTAPAESWYLRSLELFRQLGDPYGEAWVLNQLGQLAMHANRVVEAGVLLHKSIGLFQPIGANWNIAWARYNLGYLELQTGQTQQAGQELAQSAALFHTCGDQRGLGWVMYGRGNLCKAQGDFAGALDNYRASLSLLQAVEDTASQSWILYVLGSTLTEMGNTVEAGKCLHASLKDCQHCGDDRGTGLDLTGFARLALADGQPERAASLVGAAEACFLQTLSQSDDYSKNILGQIENDILEHLEAETYRAARQVGMDFPTDLLKQLETELEIS
jgi:tetratricopeptide (TPR) repeat protein